MKTCTKCEKPYPLADFYKHRGGLTARCRHCLCAAAREWGRRPEVRERRRGRDKGRPRSRTPEQEWAYRLSKYGLTDEQYQTMLSAQGGRCAVCRSPNPGRRSSWHIDHDHSCCSGGKSCGRCVRGLLCAQCNWMLGNARDNTDILRAAVQYLEGFPALLQALGSGV